jgi:hypothetical protein
MGIIKRGTKLIPKTANAHDKSLQVGKNEIQIGNIDEKDLPDIISGQFEKLFELEEYIKKAIDSAEKAEKRADSAYGESSGFWNRKNAIEAIQSSGIYSAEALKDLAVSQKIQFEFQTKLAEVSKFLFMLGVGSIALNRTTIQQLQLQLENAPKEKISQLVQNEITNVITQLRTQQDMLAKQQTLEKNVKEVHATQKSLDENVEEHEGLINRTTKKIKDYARKIKNNADLILSLNEQIEKINIQCKTISRLQKKQNEGIELNELKIDELNKTINKYKIYFFIASSLLFVTLLLTIFALLK